MTLYKKQNLSKLKQISSEIQKVKRIIDQEDRDNQFDQKMPGIKNYTKQSLYDAYVTARQSSEKKTKILNSVLKECTSLITQPQALEDNLEHKDQNGKIQKTTQTNNTINIFIIIFIAICIFLTFIIYNKFFTKDCNYCKNYIKDKINQNKKELKYRKYQIK
ncbi:hypothetical protein AB837_00613 [bacterium AB1]|nr:hypothetical protein AB837_00613 [bacterium AB1]